MQSLKSIRLAEVDNFFKQSFEQKKNWFHCSLYCSVVHPPMAHTQHPADDADDGPGAETAVQLECCMAQWRMPFFDTHTHILRV